MSAVTKKHPIENELVTVRLRVHRRNVAKIREYAQAVEAEEERSFTVAEVFPEFQGKESQVALRAYRNREGLTQKQLADLTGIPQHHLSEMENGKRGVGKDRARKLAKALNISDYRLLL
ncbi:helix-turn-helix domain-containing protein [Geoalkalibacter halelectricus]|uniref:helix-turn-helix domain-containing protein n=1 Tax=Geoalkalibacter halelectricus TaxID=2847045 RepID=UPI003D23AB73